ncbi:50S ribosomal protein L6 [Candidatus Woesearchaeota archaeon]|jgi:large subunit ribosomal protein L6|nr:50S ribosomal protein L6 [Candidatus Woesearchaeota archaeon]MBT5924806.1 50S ribosomal protein L6 [Candidatus Woesearchaeota archaeon]MBT6367830.1 50S ribosomal protein L6 [Candidatus Woesearchaeota archaeon]MBT7762725.1 50S ribosomal protein L6 [Candidatus Woesearchaeota archaeon]
MKEDITQEVVLDAGVTAVLDTGLLTIQGPKGSVQRVFNHPKIALSVDSGKITLQSPKSTKREKKIISSFRIHIQNMVKGVQEPFIYKLKICSGHFPMNVSVSGNDFIIKNFLGEAVPRKITFNKEANVKIDGSEIVVTSVDKEVAGQTAGSIETMCRITNRDRRIFQDGCYIIHKAGKDIV